MKLRTCVLCCLVVASLLPTGMVLAGDAPAGVLTPAAMENRRFDNPSYSPDGKWVAASDARQNAVYLYNVKDKTAVEVANSPSGGYAYNWSPDGAKLGLKALVPTAGSKMPLQVPVVIDVATNAKLALSEAVSEAGVPSFSADGQIAYTIGKELRIADASGKIVKTLSLDNYANLAPISPDGTKVAYNDTDEHIRVVDLGTGHEVLLTDDENGYFNPVWSPDSTKVVVSTISGWLRGIDVATGKIYDFGPGQKASWSAESKTVYFSKVEADPGTGVSRADIYEAQFADQAPTNLTADGKVKATAACVARDSGKIVYAGLDGEIYEAPLVKPTNKSRSLGTAVKLGEAAAAQSPPGMGAATAGVMAAQQIQALVLAAPVTTKVGGTVPYVHQVYDTPDNFNGNSACGATSASMCLGYTGKVGYWDVTCCCPSSHVSHYGRYICQIYTNNGVTYNIGSPDPNGVTAYGGFGYITRNNWLDTKGYMRDYFNNHGTPSSVDWSPTFAKLKTEVNASHPFVVLNMLTTAGHYIVAIGYANSQYTACFNDPYGNKNSGYMNYSGTGVYYDWPGYNYGYSNLNTVSCFIYSRADRPVSWAATYRAQSYPSSMPVGGTATVWAEFNNTGTGHWTHGATYLGTQGPQDRSSPFCTAGNWFSCSRPSEVDQSDVANGQVGRFTFIMTAPGTPGTYTEKFKPVQEGVTWFGPEITWTITVTGSDTTPPSVPTGLTATAASTSQINLSWTASTDNVGVTGYKIYRNGAYLTSVAGTTYNNTGLAMGTTYSYTVSAYDAANNESAQSAAKDETTWIIVDNVDAGFTASANWSTGTSSPDKYGTNYRFRSTSAISDQATWAFTIPTADTYEVYAWWSVGANRSTTAPYSVNGGAGIPKNQQTAGGQWNSLGTFSMAAGSNNVRLSCWTTSGFVVIADAVRIVRR